MHAITVLHAHVLAHMYDYVCSSSSADFAIADPYFGGTILDSANKNCNMSPFAAQRQKSQAQNFKLCHSTKRMANAMMVCDEAPAGATSWRHGSSTPRSSSAHTVVMI